MQKEKFQHILKKLPAAHKFKFACIWDKLDSEHTPDKDRTLYPSQMQTHFDANQKDFEKFVDYGRVITLTILQFFYDDE